VPEAPRQEERILMDDDEITDEEEIIIAMTKCEGCDHGNTCHYKAKVQAGECVCPFDSGERVRRIPKAPVVVQAPVLVEVPKPAEKKLDRKYLSGTVEKVEKIKSGVRFWLNGEAFELHEKAHPEGVGGILEAMDVVVIFTRKKDRTTTILNIRLLDKNCMAFVKDRTVKCPNYEDCHVRGVIRENNKCHLKAPKQVREYKSQDLEQVAVVKKEEKDART
jgi:hypothetical protein